MQVAHQQVKAMLRHKAHLIVNFVRLQPGEGEGRLCSEDGCFDQNVFLWEERDVMGEHLRKLS